MGRGAGGGGVALVWLKEEQEKEEEVVSKKCISLDATRNELISSLAHKITKYCHVCCFLEYCTGSGWAVGHKGKRKQRTMLRQELMLKKISTSNINSGQKL